MKLTMAERWVRSISIQPRHRYWWMAPAYLAMALLELGLNISIWREIRDGAYFTIGFTTGVFALVALLLWERRGWLSLAESKDAQLQLVREPRDDLRRQRDALLIDHHGGETETRFRE